MLRRLCLFSANASWTQERQQQRCSISRTHFAVPCRRPARIGCDRVSHITGSRAQIRSSSPWFTGENFFIEGETEGSATVTEHLLGVRIQVAVLNGRAGRWKEGKEGGTEGGRNRRANCGASVCRRWVRPRCCCRAAIDEFSALLCFPLFFFLEWRLLHSVAPSPRSPALISPSSSPFYSPGPKALEANRLHLYQHQHQRKQRKQ